MYQKLLISAGGGIVARNQQAEQDNCATIAIGLGGTGISCLRTLKKEIFNRVKPDDGNTVVARYKHIKFLAVDTDKSSIGDNGSIDSIDANTEFFSLSNANITGLLSQAHMLQQDPSLNWLKTANNQGDGNGGITIQSAEAGAGGVRQIGRLLLIRKSNEFEKKLESIITEARKDLPANSHINIHIFTGMSGGTGAGTFLDVCYIIQHALSRIGLDGQAYTCGYFFLPDVNIDKTPNVEYLPVNGFASMKELDYCMNFENNGDKWEQQYDGYKISTKEPPVKLAHLITATSATGVIVTNAYEYAMHVAVDYVMEYIIKPYVGTGNNPENDGIFSIKSHISNVNNNIMMVDKKHGASYNYCILGAASAYLPFKDITTYLASKIFEGFSKLTDRTPTDNEVSEFVKNNELEYKNIYRSMLNKAPAITVIDVDSKLLKQEVQGIDEDTIPHSLNGMLKAKSAAIGKYEENKSAMLDRMESDASDGKINSIYARVKKALINDVQNPDKGPKYVAGMLHNMNSNDLKNKFQGYIKQCETDLNQCKNNMSLREDKIRETLFALKSSNVLTRNQKAKDYVSAIQSFLNEELKIKQYSCLMDILYGFSSQIDDLYNGYFHIFDCVFDNIKATFDANLSTLSNPVSEDTSYSKRLMTIAELKPSLDEAVSRMKMDDQIQRFLSTMLRNSDSWIAQNENKICNVVIDYFLSELHEYTNKTIVDYLHEKYNTTDPALIQRHVYADIILPMSNSSEPLFWVAPFYDISSATTMGYLSIPNISDEIKAAADEFKTGHNEISIRTAYSTERISMYRFVCGVPMFGYKGVDNYKSKYKEKKIIGSHIYEGSVRDQRDSRTVINVSPISCVAPEDYSEEDILNIANFEFAIENGIIEKKAVGDGFEYRINIFNKDKLDAEIEKMKLINTPDDIREYKATNFVPETVDSKLISGVEEKVVRDHVLASQLYKKIVSEQTSIIKEYKQAKERLDDILNKFGRAEKDIHDFVYAILTGVISRNNDFEYSFLAEKNGIETKINLTDIDKVPFGMSLPLYSAYLGYCDLSEDRKSEIEKQFKNRMINDSSIVNTCCNEASTCFSKDRLNKMANVARTSFSDDAGKIVEFLGRFNNEMTNFIALR